MRVVEWRDEDEEEGEVGVEKEEEDEDEVVESERRTEGEAQETEQTGRVAAERGLKQATKTAEWAETSTEGWISIWARALSSFWRVELNFIEGKMPKEATPHCKKRKPIKNARPKRT